jgi:hypothetical protein
MPTTDRQLLTWGAAVFGAIAAGTTLVFGVVDGDIIALAGAIGLAWAAYALMASFLRADVGEVSAVVHTVAGTALILAVGLATGGWLVIAIVVAGWLVACAIVWASDRPERLSRVTSRFRPRSAR